VADRKKDLQDAKIRLENKSHRERSPSIEQLCWLIWAKAMGALPMYRATFGTDMVGVMGNASHPLYFHFLEHLNDGEYSPSIMFPSFPSIYNDTEHSLSFLSLFPFNFQSICNDREYSLSKNPLFPFVSSLKIGRIANPWFGTR